MKRRPPRNRWGTGRCPSCGQWFALKKSGRLVYHKGRVVERGRCAGVDQPPDTTVARGGVS